MLSAHDVELIVGLIAVVAAIALLAEKLRIPYPILLVLGGLGLSFIPNLPHVEIDPQIVFFVFLPPLLFWAGILTSWRDFVANIRPILLLAVGLVLATTFVVAGVATWLVPGMTFVTACVLGAIISPPDAVAAAAVTERLRVPRRIISILEGESLVNDATALVTLLFAIEAVSRMTSVSLPAATLKFVMLSVGGIAIGLGVGWIATQVRKRVHQPHVEGIIALLTPYFAYLPAELLHVSGVLSVVAAGIFISRQLPRSFSADSRMRQAIVWETLVFMLNGAVFILIGLHLPVVVENLHIGIVPLIGYASAIALAAIVVRIAWVFGAAYLTRLAVPGLARRDPPPPAGALLVIGWAGMRGIVSLAAALAVPKTLEANGSAFPMRNEIIFITFCVILATLVLQGLSLPLVIRAARLADDGEEAREERQARLDAAHAAQSRLSVMELEESLDGDIVMRLRAELHQRIKSLGGTIRDDIDPSFLAPITETNRLRKELLVAERMMITMLRDQKVIGDDVLRRILREIDLEEAKLA